MDHGAHPFGDFVALGLALALPHKVDLNVGHVGTAPEKIMADQAAKIKGGGCPDVHLIMSNFRNGADGAADLPGQGGRIFEGRPFGHVDDHLKFTLVVKGQHFHPDPFKGQKGEGRQEQKNNHEEESVPQPGIVNQRGHDPAVKPGWPAFPGMNRPPIPLEEAPAGPGGYQEGNQEGEQHRRRSPHRDRSHVRTHQPADKSHGDNGRNHGQSRQDGGVAHFIDRLAGNF